MKMARQQSINAKLEAKVEPFLCGESIWGNALSSSQPSHGLQDTEPRWSLNPTETRVFAVNHLFCLFIQIEFLADRASLQQFPTTSPFVPDPH